MIEVVAKQKGYYGSKIREAGEAFTLAPQDEEENRQPDWVEILRADDGGRAAPVEGGASKGKARAKVEDG